MLWLLFLLGLLFVVVLVVDCQLLSVACWLLVIGDWLLVIGCCWCVFHPLRSHLPQSNKALCLSIRFSVVALWVLAPPLLIAGSSMAPTKSSSMYSQKPDGLPSVNGRCSKHFLSAWTSKWAKSIRLGQLGTVYNKLPRPLGSFSWVPHMVHYCVQR